MAHFNRYKDYYTVFAWDPDGDMGCAVATGHHHTVEAAAARGRAIEAAAESIGQRVDTMIVLHADARANPLDIVRVALDDVS